jgi:epoxyqueuosine reductase
MTPDALARHVKAEGRRLGFDLVAVGPADPPAHGEAFGEWIEAGCAGTMAYLERGRDKRLDPQRVLAGARAVVACALNYYQGRGAQGPPGVARYAWGEDYHAVMEPRLAALARELGRLVPGSASRAYVDTGPLLERDLAARAGLGWIGKNTMLLHPALGSFFFIGVILTTAELAADPSLPDRCGTCTRCLDACPTGAFVRPYVLDARRCIAYLTIEHRGTIPAALRPAVGAWLFGCDVCQDVCPWNRRVPPTAEAAFSARTLPDPATLLTLDESGYRERLRGSALRRARRAGLARNAAVVLGSRRDAGNGEALERAMEDPDPAVRGHAAWALGRLGGPRARAVLHRARQREREPAVLDEIERALTGASPAGQALAEDHAMTIDPTRDALIVVDVQTDFCPGGALGVRGGDEIVPVINDYAARFRAAGAPVFATRDWHPRVTRHFQAYGGPWPPHCVQGTPGADFHPALRLPPEAVVVSKGMDPDEDAYSGFQARDAGGRTLPEMLAERGVRRVFVGGLATDYCVRATAIDAVRAGFEVVVLADAIRAVDLQPGDGARAEEEMRRAGVRFTTLAEVGGAAC